MAINPDVNKNCTTIFMVPPLAIGKERLNRVGFMSAYLGDIQKPEIEHKRGIFLLFKPKSISAFQDFVYEEKERGAPIVEDYDYEGGYVVLIYLLKEEYDRDFKRFLEGSYSRFSSEFRKLYPKRVPISTGAFSTKETLSLQYRIINKDPSLKELWEEKLNMEIGDAELWSKPVLEKDSEEYLDIERVKSGKDV